MVYCTDYNLKLQTTTANYNEIKDTRITFFTSVTNAGITEFIPTHTREQHLILRTTPLVGYNKEFLDRVN